MADVRDAVLAGRPKMVGKRHGFLTPSKETIDKVIFVKCYNF